MTHNPILNPENNLDYNKYLKRSLDTYQENKYTPNTYSATQNNQSLNQPETQPSQMQNMNNTSNTNQQYEQYQQEYRQPQQFNNQPYYTPQNNPQNAYMNNQYQNERDNLGFNMPPNNQYKRSVNGTPAGQTLRQAATNIFG